MGRNLLILEGPGAGPGARLDGAFLHVVLDEQSCLASEEVVLSAQALVAPGRSARFDLARVRRTMIDTIRRLIPFFEEGFIHAVSPHDDLGSFTLGPVNRRPPAAAPTRRPWPMAAVFSLDHQQLTREGDSLAGAPGAPLDPGASNLALTHPLVLGSLGIEGDFIVALAAADRLVEEGG